MGCNEYRQAARQVWDKAKGNADPYVAGQYRSVAAAWLALARFRERNEAERAPDHADGPEADGPETASRPAVRLWLVNPPDHDGDIARS